MPSRDPSRLGQTKLGYSRLGVYTDKWARAFSRIDTAVYWEVANFNVTRDSTTGHRYPEYPVSRTIYGVFEDRGGSLLALPAGFVQRGDAVFRCFDNVRSFDRIRHLASGRQFTVGYVMPYYDPVTADVESFAYRIMDLHYVAMLRAGGAVDGHGGIAWDEFTPTPEGDGYLCVLANEAVTVNASATSSLCVLGNEDCTCSPSSSYSLTVT